MLSVDAAGAVDGGLPSFGQQAFAGSANPGDGVSPSRGAAEAAAHQRLGEKATREIIQRLAGCLATLSRRQRLVLELLSGFDVPHALTRDQVAAALHIRSANVPRLEKTALARLRVLAQSTSCAQAAQSAPTMELASYTVLAAPGGVEAAGGGVKAARYAKAPSGGASSKRASGRSELGSIPASDTDTLWLLLAILLAARDRCAVHRRRWRRSPQSPLAGAVDVRDEASVAAQETQ